MLSDQHVAQFHRARLQAEVVVVPIQWLSSLPQRFSSWLYQSVHDHQYLLLENARLRAQVLLLQAKQQQLLQFSQENHQLGALLKSSLPFKERRELLGHILAVDHQPARHQAIVDAGSRQHIYIGQPVLDAHGVVGQVIATTALTSRILLLNDPQSAIPVENIRTHEQAIAVGDSQAGALRLLSIANAHDIQRGDRWVASGLGLCYPAGYPVGVVSKVRSQPHSQYLQVMLQPLADLDRAGQVLFIWPTSPKVVKMARFQLHQMASSE